MAHARCFSYMLIVAWKKRGVRMAGGIGTVGSSSIFEEEKNDETTKRPKIRLTWTMKTGASDTFRASFLLLTTTE